MHTPRWLRKNVMAIFLFVLVVALMVFSVRVTLILVNDSDDGASLIFDLSGSLLFMLLITLVVLARVPSRRDREDTTSDLPTGPIPRFAARIRFAPHTYPKSGQEQLRLAGGVPSADEAAGFVRGLLATNEPTSGSGFPPVPRWGEEAT